MRDTEPTRKSGSEAAGRTSSTDAPDAIGRAPAPRGKPPETVEMLAMLLATGRFTTRQICDLIAVTPAYITTMRRNPLFMQRVKAFQSKVYDSVVDTALATILADAETNVQWLKDVRDGEVVDEPAALAVRTRAATTLFERQIPKPREEGAEGGVHITINADAQARFEGAARELAETVEVEAEEMPE